MYKIDFLKNDSPGLFLINPSLLMVSASNIFFEQILPSCRNPGKVLLKLSVAEAQISQPRKSVCIFV